MNIDLLKTSLAVSTLAAGIGIAPSVVAQTTGGGSSLEEIVVTARRIEERLQDVPISITVFQQEELSRNNVTNAMDLANITPSLSVNNNFGNDNASFAIRGFVQDPGTAPSVGTYFADVVAPRGPTQGTVAGDSAGPGSFFDLANVQVLKGPQGTLFGRNTTGGAVLLVPQKPTAKSEAYAEVSAGNYNMMRVQGAVNALLSDAARFRIAVDHQKREGYLHNIADTGPKDFNDVNYTAVRASLVLDLTSNIENYSILSYSKSDTHGGVQKLIHASPVGSSPVNPALGFGNLIGVFSYAQLANEAARGTGFYDVNAPFADPESRVEQWQVINTTTWHVNDSLTVKNIASYAEYTDLQRTQLFGTNWQLSQLPAAYQGIFSIPAAVGVPTTGPNAVPLIPQLYTGIFPPNGVNTADQSTYTEELQLQGTAMSQKLTYQGGAYFEWSDPLAAVGNQSLTLLPCASLATLNCYDTIGTTFSTLLHAPISAGSINYTVGKTTYRDQGLYAQSSYSFTDKFKLTAGARYTRDKQTNDATRTTYTFPTLPPTNVVQRTCTDQATTANACRAVYEKKSSKPTWMIDFDYKPTEDMLLYAKYARGYRAGGIYSNAPADHRTFDPEKVDNFEVGYKTTWQGALPGRFNVAAFYNNFSNQQLQIGYVAAAGSTVAPTTGILNAGKSRIYGAEVEASISPLQGLIFGVNYTYLKTEIREIGSTASTDPNYVSAVFITPGLPLTLSPKNKAVITGRYTLPLDQSIGAIYAGATYAYTSSQLSVYNYNNPMTVSLLGGNYGTLPSRSLLNLDAGWTSIFGSGVDLSAFGTNVTNKKYYQYIPGLGVSVLSGGNEVNLGMELANVGEPRMYGVRLRYRFGQ